MLTILKQKSRQLKDVFFQIDQTKQVVLGFDEFCQAKTSKKALVSYLVSPLLPLNHYRNRAMFSNAGIAKCIPQALNELGYVVDIISYDNVKWRPAENYDLFIGHGGINFESISRQLPDKTIQIYFSTGIYWKESNIREARRIYDLALRRGYLIAPDRVIQNSEEFANQAADGIICLGNQEAVRTYKQFPCVIGINNASYPVTRLKSQTKDYEQGRKHFLFFSGGGNVHKGLDLLLEAFAGTDLHLHICQKIDPQFAKVYDYELRKCPNIHSFGFIPMRSAQFISLVNLCNWTILASCAEGQPGATIECMAYGLIPILPVSANIDLEDFGFQFPDSSIDAIRSIIYQASEIPVDDCKKRSSLSIKISETEYTAERFKQNFKSAVQEIVARVRNR
jgi:hypothetical protein